MDGVLPGYTVDSSTWFYLSLLLILTIYFRFNRIWSLRNLDLLLLLALSPALLLVRHDSPAAYPWLFTITGLLLVRLFVDARFRRRPLHPQNLNTSGLIFIGCATFTFLMAVVVTFSPTESTLKTVERGKQLVQRDGSSESEFQLGASPTSAIIAAPVGVLTEVVAQADKTKSVSSKEEVELAARVMVIGAHLAIVLGLFYIGYKRFENIHLGIAMAVLYLLVPCTSIHVGELNQVLPAALILWAVALYRQPWYAGALMGMACGAVFFPVFLLPLWSVFYGRKGARQFLSAWGGVIVLLLLSLLLVSTDSTSFLRQTVAAIDWQSLSFDPQTTNGFWSSYESAYRIPVIAIYLVSVASLTLWPTRKNLEHLIANSTAIIVGTQFWYPQQGGIYVLWYVPLLLLVIFRPHLHRQDPPGYEDETQAAQSPRETLTKRLQQTHHSETLVN